MELQITETKFQGLKYQKLISKTTHFSETKQLSTHFQNLDKVHHHSSPNTARHQYQTFIPIQHAVRTTSCKTQNGTNKKTQAISYPIEKTRHPINQKPRTNENSKSLTTNKEKASMSAGTCWSEARAREEKQKQNAWTGFEEGSDHGCEGEREKHFPLNKGTKGMLRRSDFFLLVWEGKRTEWAIRNRGRERESLCGKKLRGGNWLFCCVQLASVCQSKRSWAEESHCNL